MSSSSSYDPRDNDDHNHDEDHDEYFLMMMMLMISLQPKPRVYSPYILAILQHQVIDMMRMRMVMASLMLLNDVF